jgi:hypothetical protein
VTNKPKFVTKRYKNHRAIVGQIPEMVRKAL